MLLAVSELTEEQVLDALDAALEARVIEHPPGDQERFAFAHALIQQTLSEELPIHRRRRLHIRIGEALAHTRSGQSASAALARHFLLGGDTERASSMRFALVMTRQRVTRMPKLRITIESRWICCPNILGTPPLRQM